MTATAPDTWQRANQRYLAAELQALKLRLRRHAAHGDGDDGGADWAARVEQERTEAAAALPQPAALDALTAAFGLTRFERTLLLLCAGVELDAEVGRLCADAQGDPTRPYPTFGLALAALPDAHWSALTPDAPLRRWRLLETGGAPLTRTPLQIDERVLHYLAGLEVIDESLAAVVQRVEDDVPLTDDHARAAVETAAVWRAPRTGRLPVVQLSGDDPSALRAVARALAAAVELDLVAVPAAAIPTVPAELHMFIRLWEREAALARLALLIETEAEGDPPDAARSAAVTRILERARAALLVTGRGRRRLNHRPLLTVEVPRPDMAEQRRLWRRALDRAGLSLDGAVEGLVSQFTLGIAAIDAAVDQARDVPGDDPAAALWDACRLLARPRVESLAQRIEPAAGWDDLVLPEAQVTLLRQIVVHARNRARVYETWGFGARETRGLGVTALFAGASGTGKTLAAEVIAHELRLDLYRIDLSQVVSKYIGETESNLRRVFDAAEEGGAVLLFDEADALFGRRSEVRDSHDRYANIEVSYLLQRMEAYRGLAILTTNMKGALDPAFLRRLRTVVQFPFPDAERRAAIWRRAFPPATPAEGLDLTRLAQLNIPGGHIRNIALQAAFLAADDEQPVRMSHVLRATRAEYAKLERPLTDAEIGGWGCA
jgi:hypothetical protein